MIDSTRRSDSKSRPDSTRRTFLRRAAAATTTTAAVALAGCTGALPGGEETTPDDDALPPASASVEVTMGEDGSNAFAPEIAHVETGGTVTWTNVTGRHSATAYAPENDQPRRIPEDAESWDSTVLTGPDESFSHTFETPGVYDYYCTPHEGLGMVGTVVVGDPSTVDQPALTSPSDDLPRGARNKLETLTSMVMSALVE